MTNFTQPSTPQELMSLGPIDPAADTISKIRGAAFRGPSHLKVLFNT